MKAVLRPGAPAALAILVLASLAGAALLLATGGGPQPTYDGLPDPGALTGYGVPVLSMGSDVLAVVVVGSLLVPLLTMKSLTDDLSGPGLRAVVSVRRMALLWLLMIAAEMVFTLSDQLAVPAWHLTPGLIVEFVTTIDQGRSLGLQAVLVLMVAVASRWVLTIREAGYLLLMALIATLPPVLTGHASAAGSHDTAILSMLLHVVGVMVWAGGVVALWWHLRSSPTLRMRAATRFSPLAAWGFAIVAASGVVNALVRLGSLSAFVTSGYGRGVLAKIAILGLLGLLGLAARRAIRTRGTEQEGLGAARLAALGGVETALMTVAVALGAALSRTPPPVGEPYVSAAESLLAGPVPPPPTTARMLTEVTPSGVGLAVMLLGGAAYIAGILALRRRGQRWPVLRTIAWFAGLLVVGYATVGGLGVYSRMLFSVHMVAHMALSMMAPILLVVGAPLTLALQALPGSDLRGGTGPRQMLAGALRSRPMQVLTHPAVAAFIFVASVYVVYLSGIFDELMLNHLGHAFMELHFLLAGMLFFEVLIGIAPLPRRLPYIAAVGLMVIAMSFHAFFAISVMNMSTLIGGDYYRVVGASYGTDLQADQYVAGSLTWAFGEIPLLLVLGVLLVRWVSSDAREAARFDRKADRDGDAELAEYNAWLAQLGESQTPPQTERDPGSP